MLYEKKAIIEFISKAKEQKYSESNVSEIIKNLKLYNTSPSYDDEKFNKYILIVIESVIAGKSLYLACLLYTSRCV